MAVQVEYLPDTEPSSGYQAALISSLVKWLRRGRTCSVRTVRRDGLSVCSGFALFQSPADLSS